MAVLLAMLVFLTVVVVSALPFVLGTNKERQEVVRRLAAIESARKRGQDSANLRLMRDELLSSVPTFNRLLLRWPLASRLRRFLEQAGLQMKLGKLVLISAVATLSAYLVIDQIYRLSFLSVLAGIGGGSVPFVVVAILRHRRIRRFEKNFPEAIDLLARAVRAGHAFSTGLEMIATELPEPVAGEFRNTFEEQNLGLPLRDALLNLTERVPLIDVRFFVTALIVQKDTGGNLAEILDNLAATIRDRFRILGEVRVRTAQGRLTAAILIALPPFMMLLIKSINPTYLNLLFDDPWGNYILGTAAALQVIGSAILWKIVHIEV